MTACGRCGATGDEPCWSYWPTTDDTYVALPTWRGLPHAARTGKARA